MLTSYGPTPFNIIVLGLWIFNLWNASNSGNMLLTIFCLFFLGLSVIRITLGAPNVK